MRFDNFDQLKCCSTCGQYPMDFKAILPFVLTLYVLMKASPKVIGVSPVNILNVLDLPAEFTPKSPKPLKDNDFRSRTQVECWNSWLLINLHSPGGTPKQSLSTAR